MLRIRQEQASGGCQASHLPSAGAVLLLLVLYVMFLKVPRWKSSGTLSTQTAAQTFTVCTTVLDALHPLLHVSFIIIQSRGLEYCLNLAWIQTWELAAWFRACARSVCALYYVVPTKKHAHISYYRNVC